MKRLNFVSIVVAMFATALVSTSCNTKDPNVKQAEKVPFAIPKDVHLLKSVELLPNEDGHGESLYMEYRYDDSRRLIELTGFEKKAVNKARIHFEYLADMIKITEEHDGNPIAPFFDIVYKNNIVEQTSYDSETGNKMFTSFDMSDMKEGTGSFTMTNEKYKVDKPMLTATEGNIASIVIPDPEKPTEKHVKVQLGDYDKSIKIFPFPLDVMFRDDDLSSAQNIFFPINKFMPYGITNYNLCKTMEIEMPFEGVFEVTLVIKLSWELENNLPSVLSLNFGAKVDGKEIPASDLPSMPKPVKLKLTYWN